MPEESEQQSHSNWRYTAYEQWDYHPFIYVHDQSKSWISFKESFYRASEIIVDNLARGNGFPEIEGIAAVFLFRHYLELVLKSIILNGRWLVTPDRNATRDRVEAVRNIHDLQTLWQMVLKDGKPNTYLIEIYGQNQEWEDIQNDF